MRELEGQDLVSVGAELRVVVHHVVADWSHGALVDVLRHQIEVEALGAGHLENKNYPIQVEFVNSRNPQAHRVVDHSSGVRVDERVLKNAEDAHVDLLSDDGEREQDLEVLGQTGLLHHLCTRVLHEAHFLIANVGNLTVPGSVSVQNDPLRQLTVGLMVAMQGL